MRVKRRSPSGKIKFHERKERPAPVKCANCNEPLHGTPRLIQSQMNKLSASEKNPNRPYGGYLCSDCAREILREKARNM